MSAERFTGAALRIVATFGAVDLIGAAAFSMVPSSAWRFVVVMRMIVLTFTCGALLAILHLRIKKPARGGRTAGGAPTEETRYGKQKAPRHR
jgi:hypothetical protein